MTSEMDTSAGEQWHEFTQEVSMHGVRYVQSRKITTLRRIAWGVLVLGSLSYFCYAAYLFLDQVERKMLNTKIRMEKSSTLTFPTVTICNNNLWRRSIMFHSSAGLGTNALFDIMKDLYGGDRPIPPPVEKYNWSHPYYAPIAAINASETDKFLRHAAHPLEGAITYCYILGVRRNCTDVFEVVPTEGGFCYQLNSKGTMKAISAGKTGGVQFSLTALVDDYTTGPLSLSEGFSLTFHNSYEVPLVTDLGVKVAPGTAVSVMLHKSETRRYPPPADDGRSDCLDTEKLPNPLHYYKNYSLSACQVECKTTYTINKCGCRDILQPPLNGTKVCPIPAMLFCSNPTLHKFPSDPDGLTACSCKEPCNDNEYVAKLSSNKFPSTNYITELQLPKGVATWIEKNTAMVNIFYGKMYYHRLEEELAYTVFDMIANVGGTLGLCVGASILTICEFCEFGLMSILRCFKRRRQPAFGGSIIKVTPAKMDFINP